MSELARLFWLSAVGAAFFFGILAGLHTYVLGQDGFGTFDSPDNPFYSVEAARGYLRWLADAPELKELYLGDVRKLDTVFPVLTALTLGGMLWCNANGLRRPIRLVLLLPAVAYVLADLAENSVVAYLIRSELPVSEVLIERAQMMTQAKFALLAIAILLALWARWFAPRRQDEAPL